MINDEVSNKRRIKHNQGRGGKLKIFALLCGVILFVAPSVGLVYLLFRDQPVTALDEIEAIAERAASEEECLEIVSQALLAGMLDAHFDYAYGVDDLSYIKGDAPSLAERRNQFHEQLIDIQLGGFLAGLLCSAGSNRETSENSN